MKYALNIKSIKSVWNVFVSFLMYFSAFLYIFMMIIITLSVILRKIGYPLAWKLEASEYILLISTFFGAGWLMQKEGHVRVDIIPNLIQKRKLDMYNGIIFLIVALICLFITIFGTITTWEAYIAGVVQVKVFNFPKWIVLSLIPFGSFVLFVETCRKSYSYFTNKSVQNE